MLLMAGFLLSATAIVAIGSMMVLQSTETQLAEEQSDPMVKLFLNTRERSIDFFQQITANDTPTSIERQLDEYLYAQYETAQSLSLDLNTSLAANDTAAPLNEYDDFTHPGGLGTDQVDGREYATLDDRELRAQNNGECYGALPYDGTGDGIIEDTNGDVVGAILWLEIEGPESSLEEYITVDVPDTDVDVDCLWAQSSTPTSVKLDAVQNTSTRPYAVGGDGVVLERRESGWQIVDSDGPTGGNEWLSAVDVTDDGDRLWVAGQSGTVGEYEVDPFSEASNANPQGTSNGIWSLAVTGDADSADVYVGDDSGQIFVSTDDGATFSGAVQPEGSAGVQAMDFYADGEGYAVNNDGDIMKTTDHGQTWTTEETLGTPSALGVDADAADDVWVSDADGDVHHWDGSSWGGTEVEPDDTPLFSIDIEDDKGYTVGNDGIVWRHHHGSWTNETADRLPDENLRGVFVGPEREIAVGANGALIET